MTDSTPIATAVAALPAASPDNPYARERSVLRELRVDSAVLLGDPFPDPALVAADGSPTSLGQIRAGRPAVVVLYRGAWCPFCNLALRTYREQLSAPLRERGIALVAVSPQNPDGSLTMKEKHQLDFAVVSDVGNAIARALGVLTRPSDDALAAQHEHGLDLAERNADGTPGLPTPTVAIVDAHGALAWIDIHPDYSTRTEPAQILAALDELQLEVVGGI